MILKTLLAIVSFLLPIIGWILCLCFNRKHNELAVVCSKWSTVGFGLQVIAILILRNTIGFSF